MVDDKVVVPVDVNIMSVLLSVSVRR